MVAEFNWWLLIVGLVVGAGLTWLVVTDARRREEDLEEADLAAEAEWLALAMADEGRPVDAGTAERLLRLHRAHLAIVPADPGIAEPSGREIVEPHRDVALSNGTEAAPAAGPGLDDDPAAPVHRDRDAEPDTEPDAPVRTPS
jgi:hypothetical protein